jgi:predicted DNA binding CopG/RHH family protein
MSKELQDESDETQDIDDINRSLQDAGVENLSPDEELNIDLAEYDGWPPEKI